MPDLKAVLPAKFMLPAALTLRSWRTEPWTPCEEADALDEYWPPMVASTGLTLRPQPRGAKRQQLTRMPCRSSSNTTAQTLAAAVHDCCDKLNCVFCAA